MKERYTLIRDARVVHVKARKLEDCDILIHHSNEGNKIAAIERHIDRRTLADSTLTVVNADGKPIMPAFCDLAVTLREPGSMYKEDLASTCKAAKAGGYGEILTYYQPDPRYPAKEALQYMQAASQNRGVAVYLTAPGREDDHEALYHAGAVAMTDRYAPFSDDGALENAMKKSAALGHTFMMAPTVPALVGEGAVNSGIAPMMKLPSISAVSEELAVARALLLAEATGCKIHISGVSTEKSLAYIRRGKEAGIPVTCDVSPCHFFFDETAILYHGNAAKLMPPLRTGLDKMAVIEAIADGTVDAVASHHEPHDKRDLAVPLREAPFGAVGLETVFSACVEALLEPGYIDIFRLAELLSLNPHKILAGTGAEISENLSPFAVGAPSRFNLVSLGDSMTVTAEGLRGKASNTPFLGMMLRGRVEKNFS